MMDRGSPPASASASTSAPAPAPAPASAMASRPSAADSIASSNSTPLSINIKAPAAGGGKGTISFAPTPKGVERASAARAGPPEISGGDTEPDTPSDPHSDKDREWPSATPERLNELILERSRSAALVLINLPDPAKNMVSSEYVEFCDKLVEGLTKVLFVHGTGKEVWSIT
mmetsp:Transcript_5035/g.16436  ORF Transcript_5035/g.16436 Transcript_5035/m.16436 type:complete len:172 (-) Transcript_5035:272-787(-)